MEKIIPFFELKGQRYEIKRTRYLLAEYDKLAQESNLSKEDKTSATKAMALLNEVKKYAEMMQELEEKFFETLDEKDEKKYLKAKEFYNKAFDELNTFEAENNGTAKVQKAGIDILEQIAIKGLAEQHFNFDENKATKIWEDFVEEVGNKETVEWLSAMSRCLFSGDNEDEGIKNNSFLSQMRKKAEQQAINRKKMMK